MDCDAFFVQVARLADPEGAGRTPCLIVGGSPDGRGVVTSASYEARAYGVRSAMPTAQALRLCPHATVVGVPRALVADAGARVRRTLETLAPVVQAASVDEFYLDLTGTERVFGGASLEACAERIRAQVREETAISVSIGGGTSRVIAKLASRRAKPAGVFVVPPGEEEAFLRTLTLADLPGVGPALAEALARRGLVTVNDAWDVQPEWWVRWFGARRGRWLHRRIHGADDSAVDPHERRRSISSERTFARDVSDDAELARRLQRLAESVAGTLRRKHLRARTVIVKVKDFDFTVRQRARTLTDAVESDRTVAEVARALLAELRWARPVAVRLIGIGVTNLVPARDAPEQLSLFPHDGAGALDTPRERLVSRTVDELRARFGREAVLRAAQLEALRSDERERRR